jgi:glycosyltransferase involved in cell wall biosynthesis
MKSIAPSLKQVSGNQRIRVARVIDRLNIGGPAKHVTWLSAGLASDEFETVLITGTVPDGEGDMSFFTRAAGVKPLVVPEMSRELSWRDALVVAKLLGQFWRLKPHIVHTHKAKAGAVGRLAAWLYRWLTPSALWLRPRACYVVHTYHGHIFHSYYGATKTRMFLAIERLMARLATDRIITISEQQLREIGGHFKVGRAGQLRVIPLGIDLHEGPSTGSQLRREFGIGEDEFLVGIVGRLCEVKNHALLLEAAARLRGSDDRRSGHPTRVRFVIIGDGHLRKELERRARELALGDCVVFTGFREDAVALYPELDLVTLTSLNEGTPVTLIEAMNRGRAVVTTEVGGVVDLMGTRLGAGDGFTIWEHGLTAESGDAEGVARAMQFLLDKPDLCREMGQRGQAYVRARLSKERLLEEIEDLYRELVGDDHLSEPVHKVRDKSESSNWLPTPKHAGPDFHRRYRAAVDE